jgi:hypothetical protein
VQTGCASSRGGSLASVSGRGSLAGVHCEGAPGQLACDEGILFGDDGDDRMWGGRGHNHLFGGHNPGLGTAGDHLDVVYPGYDPLAGNVDVDFKGVDFIMGGWGQDAMQADVSKPSPWTS